MKTPGSSRNTLCFCGSGIKRKKCEQFHPPTVDEMNKLHEDAIYEDTFRYKRRTRNVDLKVAMIANMIFSTYD